MQFSIASYSFHRLLRSGQQDMFKYITDSKDLGMALLDPWNSHLTVVKSEDVQLKESGSLATSFSAEAKQYVGQVKVAAAEAGLPIDCLAIDGAHIYEADEAARKLNRACAYRWIEVGGELGVRQMRIDSGGPAEITEEMFEIIIDGFHDLVKRCQDNGIQLLLENHWGSSSVPKNVLRFLQTVDGLSLLFDTNNWAEGMREEGWELCSPFAKSVHIKSFEFDENGNETNTDLPKVIRLLVKNGYKGVWGIESVPKDGDEYGAVRKTKALIERVLAGL